jgi:hypothetical protein
MRTYTFDCPPFTLNSIDVPFAPRRPSPSVHLACKRDWGPPAPAGNDYPEKFNADFAAATTRSIADAFTHLPESLSGTPFELIQVELKR